MLVRNNKRSDWIADQFLIFEEAAKAVYALWKKLVKTQQWIDWYDAKKQETLIFLTDLELIMDVLKDAYSTSTFERNETRRKMLEQYWDYSQSKYDSSRSKTNPLQRYF